MYEDSYQAGHLFAVPYSFADIQITQEANDTAAEFIRGKIRQTVNDPAVAEMLCPKDYPYGVQAAASTPTTSRRSTATT